MFVITNNFHLFNNLKVTVILLIFLDYLCILFCDVSLSWSFFIISNTTFFILFYILKDKNGMKKVKKEVKTHSEEKINKCNQYDYESS